MIYALDPDANGKKLWEVKLGNGGALGGIEWGFAADGENVYVPMADVSGAARKPGITALEDCDRRKALARSRAKGRRAVGGQRAATTLNRRRRRLSPE